MGRKEKVQLKRIIAQETHARNKPRKAKAKTRRNARMLELVRTGPKPYSPGVMSWLSTQLDKPASRITDDDIARVLG